MKNKKVSNRAAWGLLLTACLVILIPSLIFEIEVHILFFLVLIISILFCKRAGYSMDEMADSMSEYCKKAVTPSLILLSAGAMIGVWNACGTIPFITYISLFIIRPSVFFLVVFVGSLIFSFATGTVFGTCGTIGVVFITIAKANEADIGWCVSAAAAGAFLGYGISPIADCTNMASFLTHEKLEKSIRSQLSYWVPAFVFCGLFYVWINSNDVLITTGGFSVKEFESEINHSYRLGLVSAVPLFLVMVLFLRRYPAVLSLMLGGVSGLPICLFYQKMSLPDTLRVMWDGSGYTGCQGIFSGGGMEKMSGTVLLFLVSFSLFGLLQSCGIIDALIHPVMKWTDTEKKGNLVVLCIGILANLLSASAMCSFIFTLSCMNPVYEKKGWRKRGLLRAAFAGCLYLSIIIPWHSNVITTIALFGIEEWPLKERIIVPVIVFSFFWLTEIWSEKEAGRN